jgi:hypothetical protein
MATADGHDATDSNDYIVDAFPPTFPRPTSYGAGLIDDIEEYFNCSRNAPDDQKSHSYAISLQSIIGTVQMEYALFSIIF